MTPLAQQMLNRALSRPTLSPPDTIEWALMQPNMRCFETSAVMDIVPSLFKTGDDEVEQVGTLSVTCLGEKSKQKLAALAESQLFLPSPFTWIEWKTKTVRVALFLAEEPRIINATVLFSPGVMQVAFTIPIRGDGTGVHYHGAPNDEGRALLSGTFATHLVGLLALINSPKVIGRKEHSAHVGLQRKVAHATKTYSKAILRPWTEIKLSVTPPIRDADDPSEPTLTGAKALHFCRAHLRIRLGKLEMVRGHWRGDPDLGIVQSRYTVVA